MPLREQPITSSIPALRAAGVPFVAGAGELGVAVQVSQPTVLVGAAPHTVNLETLVQQGGHRFRRMTDADYVPIAVGPSAIAVDLASRTRDSFQIAGGQANDVVAFVVFGRFDNMVR